MKWSRGPGSNRAMAFRKCSALVSGQWVSTLSAKMEPTREITPFGGTFMRASAGDGEYNPFGIREPSILAFAGNGEAFPAERGPAFC